MASFFNDLISLLKSPSPVLAWLGLSALVSYSGPFGTYENLSLFERILFWSVVVAIAIISGLVVQVLQQRTARAPRNPTALLGTSILFGIFLAIPLAQFTKSVFAALGAMPPPVHAIAFVVATVALGTAALRVRRDVPALVVDDPVTDQMPRLFDRLEPDQRGVLIRLEVFDHYVCVVTDRGVSKLLMRFSDAISELDGVDGLRVHRSHWVARSAVKGSETDNGRLFLVTQDDENVPVSRSFRDAVAKAGLI